MSAVVRCLRCRSRCRNAEGWRPVYRVDGYAAGFECPHCHLDAGQRTPEPQ